MFGFNTSRIVRLNADWWVENMNPENGSYRLLDVSLLPKTKLNKKIQQASILIRLVVE